MNNGTILAIIILGGYVALEAYAIRKVSHRTEPAYIHNLLVEAKVATELCKASELELEARFTRTLQRVTNSYRRDLADNDPALTEHLIDQELTERIADAQASVTADVSARGCSDPDIKAHFQRYRIYARKTR